MFLRVLIRTLSGEGGRGTDGGGAAGGGSGASPRAAKTECLTFLSWISYRSFARRSYIVCRGCRSLRIPQLNPNRFLFVVRKMRQCKAPFSRSLPLSLSSPFSPLLLAVSLYHCIAAPHPVTAPPDRFVVRSFIIRLFIVVNAARYVGLLVNAKAG